MSTNNWGAAPHFEKGATVTLDCGEAGKINFCKVIGFHAYGEKHKYDLEVKFTLTVDGSEVGDTTRLYNIDGRFIHKA